MSQANIAAVVNLADRQGTPKARTPGAVGHREV
jgi:hypothetical protein